MNTQITYSRYGQTYTETFTADQARNELINFGYPGAKSLKDKEALKALNQIF